MRNSNVLAAILAATIGALLAASPEAVATEPQTCPLSVHVYSLDGHPDETAFGLWSDATAGRATGTIVAYAGGSRYRFGFANLVAADQRDTAIPPSPIVIRFDGPAHVESAYVETLGGSTCAIHEPYVAPARVKPVTRYAKRKTRIYPDWSNALRTFLAQAATAPATAAGAGEPAESPACSNPYVNPYVLKATAVVPPIGQPVLFNGEIPIKVDIAANGTLRAERVEQTSHQGAYDKAALASAAESRFAPQIYRCEPVSGDYLFYVGFGY